MIVSSKMDPDRPAWASEKDYRMMGMALEEAKIAFSEGEIPIGAVISIGNKVIATAHNEAEKRQDPTAHAELLAIQKVFAKYAEKNLKKAVIYVTKEPCAMCAGAIVLAKIGVLIYGCEDTKAGAAGSALDVLSYKGLNHKVAVHSGLRAQESASLLREFFAKKR